jgi:hypothetical protein
VARVLLRHAVTLSLALPAAGRLLAQSPTLTVTLQTTTPRVRSTGLLADGKFVGLMRSGFPLRLHYRLELWKVRTSWFDQFVREVSWDVVARNDPLSDDFVLFRPGTGRASLTRYATPDELATALEIPYTVTMRPESTGAGSGRYYFVSRLEVTTLNDSDLRELSSWLSGDVGPVVSGEGNLGDALARGAQRVLTRLAGLPRERLEARSPTIRIDGR